MAILSFLASICEHKSASAPSPVVLIICLAKWLYNLHFLIHNESFNILREFCSPTNESSSPFVFGCTWANSPATLNWNWCPLVHNEKILKLVMAHFWFGSLKCSSRQTVWPENVSPGNNKIPYTLVGYHCFRCIKRTKAIDSCDLRVATVSKRSSTSLDKGVILTRLINFCPLIHILSSPFEPLNAVKAVRTF